MKIKSLKIHNFRSIKEQSFDLTDYSLLVGANDSGKSNTIDAIRVFYDDLTKKKIGLNSLQMMTNAGLKLNLYSLMKNLII